MEKEYKKKGQNPVLIVLSICNLLGAICIAYEVFVGVLPIPFRIQTEIVMLSGMLPFACIAWGIWDTIHKKRASIGLIMGIINMGIVGVTAIWFVLLLVLGMLTWDPVSGSPFWQ